MGWSDAQFRTFTIPTGATTGARIVIDGDAGTITGYDASNNVTFRLDPINGVTAYSTDGAFVELDPFDPNLTLYVGPDFGVPTRVWGNANVAGDFYDANRTMVHIAGPYEITPGAGDRAELFIVSGSTVSPKSLFGITADSIEFNGDAMPGAIIGGAYGTAGISSVGVQSAAMVNASAINPVLKAGTLYKATVVVNAFDNGAFPAICHNEAIIYPSNVAGAFWAGFDYMTCGGSFGLQHTLVFYLKNTTAASIQYANGPTIRVQRIAGAGTVTLQSWKLDIQEIGPTNAPKLAPLVAAAATA